MASVDVVAARSSTARYGRRSPGLALFAVCAAATAYAVLVTSVVPIVPRMATILDQPLSTIGLVVTLPLISGAVLTPLLGKYGDSHGRRRVLLGALLLMTVGGAFTALIQNFAVLLVARIVQGTANAVFPLGAAIVRDQLEPDKVRRGLSVFGAMFSIGSAFGLVLGGALGHAFSGYAAPLWLSAGLGAVALLAVYLFVHDHATGAPAKADILGAALLSAALVCLLLPLSEGDTWGWSSALTIGLFLSCIVLFGLWVLVERRTSDPLVDLELFLHRPVLTTNAAALLCGMAQFISFLGLTTFVQVSDSAAGYGFSSTAFQASLFIVPGAVMAAVTTPLVVYLARRYDDRFPLVIGGIIGSLCLLGFALWHDSIPVVVLLSSLSGGALGMTFTALPGRVVHSVPQSQIGIATAMNAISRTTGQALGTAVLTAVLAADQISGTSVPHERAYVVGFLIAAAAALIGGPIVLLGAAHTADVDEGPVDLLERPETTPHPGV